MYRSRPYSVCGSASYSWKCTRLKMRNEMRCVVKMHTVEDAKWDAMRRLSIFVTVREKMVCMVSHMKATSTLLHCTPIVPILCKCGNSSTEIRKWNKKSVKGKKRTRTYIHVYNYTFLNNAAKTCERPFLVSTGRHSTQYVHQPFHLEWRQSSWHTCRCIWQRWKGFPRSTGPGMVRECNIEQLQTD